MSDKPQKNDGNLEIVVLYCQHGLSNQSSDFIWPQQVPEASLSVFMMPCSSKIEVPYILRILESGADAVEIIACPEQKCKFLIGSLRAERRIDYIRGLLEQIGYNPERVGITRKLSQSPQQILEIAKARIDMVRPLGKNPMKKGEQK